VLVHHANVLQAAHIILKSKYWFDNITDETQILDFSVYVHWMYYGVVTFVREDVELLYLANMRSTCNHTIMVLECRLNCSAVSSFNEIQSKLITNNILQMCD
jgi:hypothetical protein